MECNKYNFLKENSLYFLYRRGNAEHINALYEKGEIFINTIDYIRECDKNLDRSDPYDSIAKRVYLGNVKIRMCSVGLEMAKNGIETKAKDCVLMYDSIRKGNIYCLSGVFTDHLAGERQDIVFNTGSFGESIIFITNPKEFMNRFTEGLERNGYKEFEYRRVSYYPNSFSGEAGCFRKHERFNSQNEFRIFIQNEKNRPISFHIGPLKDIAFIGSSERMKLLYTDGIEQLMEFV